VIPGVRDGQQTTEIILNPGLVGKILGKVKVKAGNLGSFGRMSERFENGGVVEMWGTSWLDRTTVLNHTSRTEPSALAVGRHSINHRPARIADNHRTRPSPIGNRRAARSYFTSLTIKSICPPRPVRLLSQHL
jgi:hypothetical protein